MSDVVTLRINGRDWEGWTSARVSAGIDRLARDFNVEITRRWPGADLDLKVNNGDKVELLIGGDLVITGWIEAMPLRYDAASISLGITGRSLTADLIDCSALPAQHSGQTLAQIAKTLAAPFNISVIDAGSPKTQVIDSQAEHGETVIDVLHRLLGQVQTLAYDDERGRLVLGPVGAAKASTALVLGENILSCDTERSIRERFSEYVVTGQRPGDDLDFGAVTLTAIRQSRSDSGVGRYRPHTIQQSGAPTSATCKARCEFEARQRAAKTRETTYTVQGWRQGDGQLWKPNSRVIVFDPYAGFNNEELIIAEVTFQKSGDGTTTVLRVGPADAYLPEPEAPKKKKSQDE